MCWQSLFGIIAKVKADESNILSNTRLFKLSLQFWQFHNMLDTNMLSVFVNAPEPQREESSSVSENIFTVL